MNKLNTEYRHAIIIACFSAIALLLTACEYVSGLGINSSEKSSEIDSVEVFHDEKVSLSQSELDSICYKIHAHKIDSLNTIIDSLEEANMIYTIKLNRIKQYNAIAAKGKNIVFLRGWINRVLKD